MFGTANCKSPGIPSNNAPVCEQYDGHPVIEQMSIKFWHSSLCINYCENIDKCILWSYNKENTKCTIFKLEVDLLGSYPTTNYGRNYCMHNNGGGGIASAIRYILKSAPSINHTN